MIKENSVLNKISAICSRKYNNKCTATDTKQDLYMCRVEQTILLLDRICISAWFCWKKRYKSLEMYEKQQNISSIYNIWYCIAFLKCILAVTNRKKNPEDFSPIICAHWYRNVYTANGWCFGLLLQIIS